MRVIKWAMRHQQMCADEFPNLDSAVVAAAWACDGGSEALVGFEVFDDGEVTRYDTAAAKDLMFAELFGHARPSRTGPKVTHALAVSEPDNRRVSHDIAYVYDNEVAHEALAKWRVDLGDRVSLVDRR